MKAKRERQKKGVMNRKAILVWFSMLKLSRDIVGVEFFMTKRILVGCLPL
jgi:hypothetical protein